MLIIVAMVLTSCQIASVYNGNSTDNQTSNASPDASMNTTSAVGPRVTIIQRPLPAAPELPIKKVFEGEVVSLRNNLAIDPDGDDISYTYSAPLNASGEWQTEIGDAGTYTVNVTATDGDLQSKLQVVLIVQAIDSPPLIEGVHDIIVTETETVVLSPIVTDPDNDTIDVTYHGWMRSATKKTTYDDAGIHQVTIIADDGRFNTTKEITITVKNKNRPPIITAPATIDAAAGETVTLPVDVDDPDGDTVRITYPDPFDSTGTWTPDETDLGTHSIMLIASDGDLTATHQVMVTITQQNNRPSIEVADSITVFENETVTLTPLVSDPDGDEVIVSYTGWMTSATKKTGYDDAGTHTVTIIADDGTNIATADVTITVKNVNRPPIFRDDALFE
jgi:hypothetical protein